MTDTQRNMLKKFGAFARRSDFFTTSSPGWVRLTEDKVIKYLSELEKSGYIFKVRTGFKISEKGRALVDGPGASAQPTRHVNASQSTMVKLPHEMVSHRPGANDHEKHASFGTLC